MKHHYLPEFYLKRWSGADGKLVEFSKRSRVGVRPRWTSPGGTGYAKDLYAVSGVPHELRHVVEERFFRRADQDASDALDMMTAGTPLRWNDRLWSGWSRFVTSLLVRAPEDLSLFKLHFARTMERNILELQAAHDSTRKPHDEPNVLDHMAKIDPTYIERNTLELFTRIVDSPVMGQKFNDLIWMIIPTPRAAYDLLTSDRPVIRTNGMSGELGHLAVPIGPRLLFFAAPDRKTFDALKAVRIDDLVKRSNAAVVGHAAKYAYGRDERQRTFVMNRLSTDPLPSLIGLASAPD